MPLPRRRAASERAAVVARDELRRRNATSCIACASSSVQACASLRRVDQARVSSRPCPRRVEHEDRARVVGARDRARDAKWRSRIFWTRAAPPRSRSTSAVDVDSSRRSETSAAPLRIASSCSSLDRLEACRRTASDSWCRSRSRGAARRARRRSNSGAHAVADVADHARNRRRACRRGSRLAAARVVPTPAAPTLVERSAGCARRGREDRDEHERHDSRTRGTRASGVATAA